MANKHEEISLTFEKGLVTEVEDSVLEPGQAAGLLNWEPAPQGGLRPRNAWSSLSTTGLSSPYKVRGWGTAAFGSGGGYSTPAVVQESSATGIESGAESDTTSIRTASLTGCTAGNLIIGVVTYNDASPVPTLSGGWTTRVNQSGSANNGLTIATRTSAGGSESFSATKADSEGVHHVHIFEVSGLATEAPTDTDSGNSSSGSPFNASCSSATSAGFAMSFGNQFASFNAWTNPPSLTSGTTQFDTTNAVGNEMRSTLVTANYSSATVTDTIESNNAAIGCGALAIWDAGTNASSPASFYILLAVATPTGYSIYRINRDEIQTGTWELVDSEACTDTSAFVSMAVSAGELVWSASTMTNPRHVVLSTLTGADTTDLTSKAGRAVCSHKDRVFVGGSSLNPSRLYFSGIGTPHTFTTATDFLDIGGDDGEAIEDLVSVEGLLLVCKVNRLYLISGSGIESFFVNELPGGSASTGRAAVRTPYGTIVAGPTDVWVVQGGGIDPLSRSLGVDYSISGLVSTAYAQDVVLLCDSATGRIFRINLVTGAWSNEDVTTGENEPGHLFSLQSRLYYGVSSSATQAGGTRSLQSARGPDFTGGTAYDANTGRVSLKGPQFEYTPRWMYLQLRNQDENLDNELHLLVESENTQQEFLFTVSDEVMRFTRGIGAFAGAEWIRFTLSADSSFTAGAIDVEKAVLGVDVEAPR